jgi:hypothetical protein
MNFIRIKYNGKKVYTDRTPMKNRWEPGDEKLVPEIYARKGAFALLRFAEFAVVVAEQAVAAPDADTSKNPETDTNPDQDAAAAAAAAEKEAADKAAAELAQAQADVAADQAKKAEEDQQRENMLLSIGTWDKNTLIAYAAKYDTRLHKNLGEAKLRQQVSNLVEQYGVR